MWRTRRIAAYLAIDGEPDLHPLLSHLHLLGKTLALPVVQAGNRMSFSAYRPDAPLSLNRFGIQEPTAKAAKVHALTLDLALMPLVAFDRQGNRLGMGGGFYDRCFGLQPRSLRPLLVGVAHRMQQVQALRPAPWDVPLDAILTEAGWQAFSKPARL